MEQVRFTAMKDGTAEEYAFLDALERANPVPVADNVLRLLEGLRGRTLGYRVDRWTHSLQSATRALRDGADEETVVCALLHDVGDDLAPLNHGRFAAEILRPYVSERAAWIVEHHAHFQGWYYWHHVGGDRNARERWRGHRWFDDCADFCERFDQCAFDPDYDTLGIEVFEPMVRRVFARTPWGREG